MIVLVPVMGVLMMIMTIMMVRMAMPMVVMPAIMLVGAALGLERPRHPLQPWPRTISASTWSSSM